MGGWDDYDMYAYEEGMAQLADEALRETSLQASKYYLGTYGDAVEARVTESLRLADKLSADGHFSPALVFAATAIELTIRFMLVRPLVQGAFLSDEWAEILADRATKGRSVEDRKMLPRLLLQWEVNIDAVRLEHGEPLLKTIEEKVFSKRHKVVHAGETATKEEALQSIECATLLIDKVVHVIADKLGFTLKETGNWCDIHGKEKREDGSGSEWWSSFTPSSPFREAYLNLPQ